jgi:hypothetical protein
MRRSLRVPAACLAVLAAGAGCSAGGGAPAEDPAAEIARRLQGDWSACVPWAGAVRHQYTFTDSHVLFSLWNSCSHGALLVDRAVGTFAIGPRVTAAVSGAGLEVVAWELDVTWTTSVVSRTAVALTDPRDPEPYVLFAGWDAEGSSTLVPTVFARTGAPLFVFADAVVGSWARCVSATRADLRGFEGPPSYHYAEGWFAFDDACLGRRTETHPTWGLWGFESPIIAALDGILVTGHLLPHVFEADTSTRTQTGFIARTADGNTLFLSDVSMDRNAPVLTLSSATGAWVRVDYALPPPAPPPGPIEEGGPAPPPWE